ncbi:hypothetical protein EYZ11_011028 [Aspergillus tanneri]|uniref:Uncharacterized protein n=1 Tax=Aspergillus tanneri TaxID=1220188 RepID=A0A4S3J3U8_9EURO|nr:hypothetical protein EYZ11_011028 [Aspergillus tanneri]
MTTATYVMVDNGVATGEINEIEEARDLTLEPEPYSTPEAAQAPETDYDLEVQEPEQVPEATEAIPEGTWCSWGISKEANKKKKVQTASVYPYERLWEQFSALSFAGELSYKSPYFAITSTMSKVSSRRSL